MPNVPKTLSSNKLEVSTPNPVDVEQDVIDGYKDSLQEWKDNFIAEHNKKIKTKYEEETFALKEDILKLQGEKTKLQDTLDKFPIVEDIPIQSKTVLENVVVNVSENLTKVSFEKGICLSADLKFKPGTSISRKIGWAEIQLAE